MDAVSFLLRKLILIIIIFIYLCSVYYPIFVFGFILCLSLAFMVKALLQNIVNWQFIKNEETKS